MLIDDYVQIMSTLLPKSEHAAKKLAMLVQTLRFQVDNVAAYVHSNIGSGFYAEREVPNIAPLAPYMWFEYNGLSVGLPSSDQFGCLISIDFFRDGFKAKKWEEIDNIHPDTEWILRTQYYCRNNEGYGTSDWIYFYEVNYEGQMLDHRIMPNFERGPDLAEDYTPDETQKLKWHEEIIVALTAICFAHCKGTEIEEHQPTRQVRRAAERAGKPVFTFHTIDIHPARQVLRTEGKITENGIAKALHICRGHFAHYTADKPLFGKYTGTFYRPMHIRGSAEKGIVGKDYRIHPEVPA